ncbi:hypothetical protein Tco_0853055, partial [Tanacetum coccineum]
AKVELAPCGVGLLCESDGFVLGCRGRGERDGEIVKMAGKGVISITDARERYFRENSFDRILIPFLLSPSLSIWLIEAMFSEAIESHADSGTGEIISSLSKSRNHLMPFQASFGVGGFIEIPWFLVLSEQDELPSSVGLDFRARLDGGRMYSGHLETEVRGMSIRFAPTGWCRIKEVPRCSLRELNGIPVALVARSGIVSKSTDRILMVVDENGLRNN